MTGSLTNIEILSIPQILVKRQAITMAEIYLKSNDIKHIVKYLVEEC